MQDADKSPLGFDPEETEIQQLFEQLQPKPSARFYRRMHSAPWQPASQRPARWGLRLAYATFALLVIAGLILTLPPLRATATQMMNYFFRASSDTINVPVTVLPVGPTQGSQSDGFNLNLEQAQAQAGFTLMQPENLPPELTFDGARYDAALQTVILRYSGDRYSLFFAQRKLGPVQEYWNIGANAPVEKVQVRSLQAELVTGGWRFLSGGAVTQAPSSAGTPVVLGVYWDPDLPQQTLAWQENGRGYEILLSGQIFEKSFLINLAEGIK